MVSNVAAFDDNGKQIGTVFETASPFDTARHMVENGYLSKQGGGRSTWYVLS